MSNTENILIVYLPHDIDTKNTKAIHAVINTELSLRPVNRLILDFSKVDFMDNSGIGFITSQYKAMKEKNGVCEIANPPKYIAQGLKLSGIDRLCRIIKNDEVLNTSTVNYISCEG